MNGYNKVLLMGNLTRDPEVRYTPKGTAVATITLAINRSYTLDSGEQKDEVLFVDVDLWGRQAETAGQYLAKGRPLFVEGRLKQDSWEDKETKQKRSRLKVVCERFQFIGGPGRGAEFKEGAPEEAAGNRTARRAAATPPAQPPAEPPPAEPHPPEDDNIPF